MTVRCTPPPVSTMTTARLEPARVGVAVAGETAVAASAATAVTETRRRRVHMLRYPVKFGLERTAPAGPAVPGETVGAPAPPAGTGAVVVVGAAAAHVWAGARATGSHCR